MSLLIAETLLRCLREVSWILGWGILRIQMYSIFFQSPAAFSKTSLRRLHQLQRRRGVVVETAILSCLQLCTRDLQDRLDTAHFFPKT